MQNEGLKRRVNELEVEVSKKFSNTSLPGGEYVFLTCTSHLEYAS